MTIGIEFGYENSWLNLVMFSWVWLGLVECY